MEFPPNPVMPCAVETVFEKLQQQLVFVCLFHF